MPGSHPLAVLSATRTSASCQRISLRVVQWGPLCAIIGRYFLRHPEDFLAGIIVPNPTNRARSSCEVDFATVIGNVGSAGERGFSGSWSNPGHQRFSPAAQLSTTPAPRFRWPVHGR